VSSLLLFAASSLDGALGGPVDQQYLLEARQVQALSFAVHIPLVCFGISFPAMVLFVEGLYLRTGDPLYKALDRRAATTPSEKRGERVMLNEFTGRTSAQQVAGDEADYGRGGDQAADLRKGVGDDRDRHNGEHGPGGNRQSGSDQLGVGIGEHGAP
jgi:hypothetical protein